MALYAQIDCALPNNPKIIEAGPLAELAYIRLVLHCRANLTDGVVDRRVLGRALVGIRSGQGAIMTKLVEVGLLDEHAQGWCIPADVWQKWNPTKTQVDAKKKADAERQAAWRSRRSHSVTNALVTGESQRESQTVKPEPEPEPEPYLNLIASDKPTRSRKRDELWDAMALHFGEPSTTTEKSNRGRQVKELRAIGATPEQIDQRVKGSRFEFGANYLIAHWAELEPKPTEPNRYWSDTHNCWIVKGAG